MPAGEAKPNCVRLSLCHDCWCRLVSLLIEQQGSAADECELQHLG